MFLLGRKCKGISLKTFVNNNPGKYKVLDDNEIDDLATKLKNEPNDKIVKEKLFNCFIRVAISIASKYAYRISSYYHDDIVGEACLALILAINSYPQKENKNISAYIKVLIHSHLHNFLRSERTTKRLNDAVRKSIEVKVNYRDERIDIEDALNKVATDKERLVWELKKEGYSEAEIGRKLNYVRANIGHIKNSLMKKLIQLFRK